MNARSTLIGNLFAGFLVTNVQAVVDPDIDNLVAAFEGVGSIQLVASVEVIIAEDAPCLCALEYNAGKVIQGDYQLRAAGDLYRIVSQLDPAVVPNMNLEVAYDGHNFQLFRKSASVLSFGAGDRKLAARLLPDPFLAPLSFIFPRDDASDDRPLKLKEVERNTLTNGRISGVHWSTVSVGGRSLERAEFSGGQIDGRNFVFHVYAQPGQRSEPVRIEYVTANGVWAMIELNHYREASTGAAGVRWPHHVVFSGFNDEGEKVAEMSFVIKSLVLDEPIAPEVFTIDFSEANRVWSDDLEMFIQ